MNLSYTRKENGSVLKALVQDTFSAAVIRIQGIKQDSLSE